MGLYSESCDSAPKKIFFKLEKASTVCVLGSNNDKKQTTPLMRTKPCYKEEVEEKKDLAPVLS